MNPFMWYKNLIDLQPAYYRVDNAMLWRNFKVFQAHSMICPELKALFEGLDSAKFNVTVFLYRVLLVIHPNNRK